jgi:hypothetical protein
MQLLDDPASQVRDGIQDPSLYHPHPKKNHQDPPDLDRHRAY